MTNPAQFPASRLGNLWGSAFAMAMVCALTMVVMQPAQAQTYMVLHAFNGQGDGSQPTAGLTLDRAGNLYGTASGYPDTPGTVFKLSHHGSGWLETTLHFFSGRADGALPLAGVAFGPDGSLYGTTEFGGLFSNGTVFKLTPSATACMVVECPWTETILYSFTGLSDGGGPQYGNLIFDSAGNIYGTTVAGGTNDAGVVFELIRSGAAWTENVLYSFRGIPDGANPSSGVTFDNAGNLYGTTHYGGVNDLGTIYQLTPSESSWTETVLFSFNRSGSGYIPFSGVVFDPQGNLYGMTYGGGGMDDAGGTIYQLQPSAGNWTFNVLYSFNLGPNQPEDTPTLDASGNLYGTTSGGSGGTGSIFKLTRGSNGWTYTNLYDFTDVSMGYQPVGGVALDQSGNLYGTTFYGGNFPQGYDLGCGVVWELVP